MAALLQHPVHGNLLFDTGYSQHFLDATAQLPERLYRVLTPVHLAPGQSLREQLAVDWIVLSHFHGDHIGGVADFAQARIACAQQAWDDLQRRGRLAALREGFLPALLHGTRARIHRFEALPARDRRRCAASARRATCSATAACCWYRCLGTRPATTGCGSRTRTGRCSWSPMRLGPAPQSPTARRRRCWSPTRSASTASTATRWRGCTRCAWPNPRCASRPRIAGSGGPLPPRASMASAPAVLITGARAPVALDLARRFAAQGWRVHLADSVACRISGWSHAVAASHRPGTLRAGRLHRRPQRAGRAPAHRATAADLRGSIPSGPLLACLAGAAGRAGGRVRHAARAAQQMAFPALGAHHRCRRGRARQQARAHTATRPRSCARRRRARRCSAR
ncbi:MBL fold metallo-hydrolase [Xanthomonas cerealis pv. cerealis]|uniref:MBL fold metallo-hydrolase n=1 Tax=Xanthomonas cerealis pv. cerealis TaxID=152263 RepID=A0A514EIR3_9XANT|nr:MBL fold metallo-hydrolase [Xanthomonas translucens pv. cerealis]